MAFVDELTSENNWMLAFWTGAVFTILLAFGASVAVGDLLGLNFSGTFNIDLQVAIRAGIGAIASYAVGKGLVKMLAVHQKLPLIGKAFSYWLVGGLVMGFVLGFIGLGIPTIGGAFMASVVLAIISVIIDKAFDSLET